MKKLFVFFLLALVFTSKGQAELPSLESGNAAYINSDFELALANYSAIADSGYQSVALFYNLGNTHYRLGHLGKAILYYEKALKRAPKDADIKENLRLAETQRLDVFETVPVHFFNKVWMGLLNVFSASTWSGLAIGILFLSSLILIYLLKRKQKTSLLFGSYLLFAALGLVLLWLAYQKNSLDLNNTYGIVIANNTYVKSEPNNGQDLFMVHEGSKALIEENYDQWVKVRWPDGKSGWIESSTLAEI